MKSANSIITPRKNHAREVIRLLSFGLVKGLGVREPGKMCIEEVHAAALGLPHNDKSPCKHPVVRSFDITLNDSDWSSELTRARGMQRLAVAGMGSLDIDASLFVKELVLATVRQIVPIALRAAAKLHSSETHKTALEENAMACESVEDLDAARYAARYASYAARDAASYAARDAARYARDAASYARYAARDARYAASYASDAARYAARYARYAARYARYAARYASDAARYAARYARAKDDVLRMMAECGVQALIVCKSPGCKWLDLCEASDPKGAGSIQKGGAKV